MADDNPIEDLIKRETNRFAIKKSNPVSAGIQSAFRGLRKAGPSIERSAAQFQSPLISALSGIGASTPTPQEELADQVAAFESQPLGAIAPDLANSLSQITGEDFSELPAAFAAKLQGLVANSQRFQRQQELAQKNTPFTSEDRDFLLNSIGMNKEDPRFKAAMATSNRGFERFMAIEEARQRAASGGNQPMSIDAMNALIDQQGLPPEENATAKALAARASLGGFRGQQAFLRTMSGVKAGLVADQRTVDAIISGREVLSSFSKRGKTRQAVRSAVLKQDEKFDFIQAEADFQRQKTAGRISGKIGTEPEWQRLTDKINPAKAARSSLLGVAGAVNARADRELQTLSRPDLSPQQLSGAITGLASILKGGVPTEIEIQEQSYKTFKTEIANIETFWRSKPTAANQPEVVQRLRELIGDIKRVDNKIIMDNLNQQEIAFRKTVGTDATRWREMREAVIETTTGLSDETESEPTTSAAEIRELFKSGQITREQAKKRLKKLPKGSR